MEGDGVRREVREVEEEIEGLRSHGIWNMARGTKRMIHDTEHDAEHASEHDA